MLNPDFILQVKLQAGVSAASFAKAQKLQEQEQDALTKPSWPSKLCSSCALHQQISENSLSMEQTRAVVIL